MAKLIKVAVTKEDSVEHTAAVDRWYNPDFITHLQIGDSNGARFRYSPPQAAAASEIVTTTAASAIATAANA